MRNTSFNARALLCLFFSILLFSCKKNNDVAGRYEYTDVNQYCEIILDKGGDFQQIITYSSTGQRAELNGKWTQKNSGLIFDLFLFSVGDKKILRLILLSNTVQFPQP
jgi:hypothetical protein